MPSHGPKDRCPSNESTETAENTNMSSANNNEPPTPEPLNSAQTDMLLKPSSGLSHEQKKMYGHNRSPSREFKELTKRDAQILLNKELEKLQRTAQLPKAQADLVDKEFDGFRDLFGKFLTAEHQSVKWDKIEKLPADAIRAYDDLPQPSKSEIQGMLQKLVVVKLNGGLGTSMGCKGPKSVIPVRNDLTFLDLTVQQIENLNKTYDADVPLVLMNSFNTDEETHKIIQKYSGFRVRIMTFNQSRYPRINKESLMPVARDIRTENDIEAWYPPGHGDFYQSFYNSHLLTELVSQGREFAFMSNIDNMGATVDLSILNLCLKENHEFIMEVTDKTRADVKGGTLIQYEGKLRLLEVAQVAKDHLEDFKSVKKFNVFNTNNLWMSLPAITRVIEEKMLDMEVIVNPKVLEGGVNVLQLETAVGAAMKCFDNGMGINVPRSRFLPVKKSSDLLLIMSNLYSLRNGSLVMSPERMFQTTPLIKLGDAHFKKVGDFLNRFASCPDIIELDHLTVSGNVNFGKNVALRGTVIIIANHGDQIDIPSGSILENKIVSGNLRILDH
ncbi:UTP--glucose-1-phosphate uridylyltransferase-like isoform X2 [Tigriopus californicus]|uniref:UTP--glucose-1-phosphate uridylyltransferase-like isoform X2 n=1 Tax=Tigriopus californicus TaxID=6832 RepID=UPI0027DA76F8|nr:UTP--glucose-1-phosphate uridylyltransferase-like isoform X2 [Tigriopus californicus]